MSQLLLGQKHDELGNGKIRSPLRYPGGKTRAVKQILPIIPYFEEYREPMVGGGSVFFALKQLFPNRKYWINDLNKDLFLFWKYSKIEMKALLNEIWKIKETEKDGRELFNRLTSNKQFDDFDRAVRFFVLNRISFSGTVDSGGYSSQAFKRRFTDSSIKRAKAISPIVSDTKITNLDYEKVIKSPGKNVFIFLDPPYLSTTSSRLYGKNGDLHEGFDHIRFATNMKKCNHKWLITYDNSKKVKDLFNFAHIYGWQLQYGMNNYKQDKAKKGQELFISNYKIPNFSNSKIN
ncbi:DNA adenine methylase [Candidatus Woesearchaeota archaeon]|nr:DNA adenine methylase [Candidatus Woesearchaeota archaeon]